MHSAASVRGIRECEAACVARRVAGVAADCHGRERWGRVFASFVTSQCPRLALRCAVFVTCARLPPGVAPGAKVYTVGGDTVDTVEFIRLLNEVRGAVAAALAHGRQQGTVFSDCTQA